MSVDVAQMGEFFYPTLGPGGQFPAPLKSVVVLFAHSPVLGRQRQEDKEFKANLDYTVR